MAIETFSLQYQPLLHLQYLFALYYLDLAKAPFVLRVASLSKA